MRANPANSKDEFPQPAVQQSGGAHSAGFGFKEPLSTFAQAMGRDIHSADPIIQLNCFDTFAIVNK